MKESFTGCALRTWIGTNRVIFVPDSKTEEGRRRVPMSNRVFEVLTREVRRKARRMGLPIEALPSLATSPQWQIDSAKPGPRLGFLKILFCIVGGTIIGTRILKKTGNLAAVMRTMGHKDVKTAMQYQHPELEIVRAALDQDTAVENRA